MAAPNHPETFDIVEVRQGPKVCFRLSEDPCSLSGICAQASCKGSRPGSLQRGGSTGEDVHADEQVTANLSDTLQDSKRSSATQSHNRSDISAFAAFAAHHLGAIMARLAIEYEQGTLDNLTVADNMRRRGSDSASSQSSFAPSSSPGYTLGGSLHGSSWQRMKTPGLEAGRVAVQMGRASSVPTAMETLHEIAAEAYDGAGNKVRVQDAEEEVSSDEGDLLRLSEQERHTSGRTLDAMSIDFRQSSLTSGARTLVSGSEFRHTSTGAEARIRDQWFPQVRIDELESMTQSNTRSHFPYGSQYPNVLPSWLKKTLQPTDLSTPREWYHPDSIMKTFSSGITTEREVKRVAQGKARRRKDALKERFVGAALLITNAVLVLCELQYVTSRSVLPAIVLGISLGFTVLFTIELLWRAVANMQPYRSWKSTAWLIADAAVLLLLWIQQVLRLSLEDMPLVIMFDASVIRCVFFFRYRFQLGSRLPSFLREMRHLMCVCRVAIKGWLWVLIASSFVIYLCSLVLAYSTYPQCDTEEDALSRADMCRHFSTFSSTFMSLYKAIFGGMLWGDLIEAMEAAPLSDQGVLVVIMSFGVIVVANLATGMLILDLADQSNRVDIASKVEKEKHETSSFIAAMRSIFNEIDANSSGAISKDELELALEDTQMNALLRCHNLRFHDAQLLFDLLDIDRSGSIDMEEFIGGCLRMKGGAQAIDIVRLQMEMYEFMQAMVNSGSGGRDMLEDRGAISAMPSSKWQRSVSTPGPWSSSSSRHSANYAPGTANISSMLTGNVPSWLGLRIASVEERAMTVEELRTLRAQIRLHASTWQSERGCTAVRLQKVNMYDVNYNWICPLTVPDGVYLEGLTLRQDTQVGTILSQAYRDGHTAPRAIGEAIGVTPDGRLKVKVHRGRFTDISLEGAPVSITGRETCGTPRQAGSPVALSYKELVSQAPSRPDWYCCHWWGEPIMDFIKSIEEHRELRQGTASTAYWICAFANSQHDLASELSDDPENSSFRKAMTLATGVLLVLDHDATPFQRIWCDYELYKTLLSEDKCLDIATVSRVKGLKKPQVLADLPGESAVKKTIREANFPVEVLAKGVQARLEDGEATVSADKERILRYMQQETLAPRHPSESEDSTPSAGTPKTTLQSPSQRTDRNLQNANEILNAFFAWAAWPQALKNGVVTSFFGSSLPDVTAQERSRRRLRLSLAHFSELNDSAMADLARGIPAYVTEMSLSFEGCSHITDLGMHHLSIAISRLHGLQRLQLDFLGCKRVTNVGLGQLSRSLPQGLTKLRLDFAKCTSIGYVGITQLAQNLPPGLREFTSTFKGTEVDMNFESVDDLRQAGRLRS